VNRWRFYSIPRYYPKFRLSKTSGTATLRKYETLEPCTFTVQIQNPRTLPVEQSSVDTLRSLKQQEEEKEEEEDKKKKKKNYNFATFETLRGNSTLVFSWKMDILTVI
jgi:hypothetical protein